MKNRAARGPLFPGLVLPPEEKKSRLTLGVSNAYPTKRTLTWPVGFDERTSQPTMIVTSAAMTIHLSFEMKPWFTFHAPLHFNSRIITFRNHVSS